MCPHHVRITLVARPPFVFSPKRSKSTQQKRKMKIQVKTVLYKLLTLEVEETETIRDVVQRVQLLEGRDTPYDLEGLAYGGKILPPTSTVADQAIPPDATLHQVKRGLRGASTPANQQP